MLKISVKPLASMNRRSPVTRPFSVEKTKTSSMCGKAPLEFDCFSGVACEHGDAYGPLLFSEWHEKEMRLLVDSQRGDARDRRK